MNIKVNNDYKCIMFIPNINYWFEDGEPKYIFVGWLRWGIVIVFDNSKP